MTPLRHEPIATRHRRSILAHRRVQFLGALLIAALLPFVSRILILDKIDEPSVFNVLLGNIFAITMAMWLRLSIEPYPGIRSSYVILPAALVAHGVVVVFFVLTRLPYDRLGLSLGFFLHVAWNYLAFLLAERRSKPRIAVVPFGSVDDLLPIKGVEWMRMSEPLLSGLGRSTGIVADFTADLPDEWEGFLAEAALQGKIVFQVKQLQESLTGRVELDHLSENNFGLLVPARGYFHLKEVLDFFFAVAVLPIVVPVLALAAVVIRLEGPGPVIFRQRRLGHAGRIITVFKLRTMQPLSSEGNVPDSREMLATDLNDPRISRVGGFLRRLRIDELPQIWNILKGEMSWIGPRPEPQVLSKWFVSEIPFYRYRHVVKPGISGWAQVNQGYVSGISGINEKLQYDFYYIKYFSPWLDLLIVLRTLKTMLTGFGSR